MLANYQQTKISAPPNLNEPIGFDQLPDGRILQTARAGQVRLHDPAKGTSQVIANIPVYTNSEDGLYGPAVDNDFATNKWVYLYYAPPTVRIKKCDGTMADVTTPTGSRPDASPPIRASGPTPGRATSSSRASSSSTATTPSLDLTSEQKIIQVDINRGACCHVAGDIDFDKNNNLWFVTGDDTPAGGGNSGGFSPHNDMKTSETQTFRVNNATGGTFTLTFNGQTTAPIPYNATAAQIQAALEALSNIAVGDILAAGNPINTANVTVNFRGAVRAAERRADHGHGAGLTGTARPRGHDRGDLGGRPVPGAVRRRPPHRRRTPTTCAARSTASTVKADGSYTIPAGNMFPAGTAKTRPEIYAMGFRNPYRIQVDSNDVAYITDYSPDSNVPENFRGPAGTGRVEIVRKPSNYGWPLCYAPNLPYYRWNFNTSHAAGRDADAVRVRQPDARPAERRRAG